jgi:hypothetical protein
MSRDRDAAPSAKRLKERPFRQRARPNQGIVDRSQDLENLGIGTTGLNCESTLPSIGKADFKRQVFGDFGLTTETMQPGGGKNDRVVAPFAQLSNSCVDVTSQVVAKLEVRPNRPKLGLATGTARSDTGAGRKFPESSILKTHDNVARIFPDGERREHQVIILVGRNVLQAVHREVDRTGPKKLRKITHEHAGTSELMERNVGHAVTQRPRRRDRDIQVWLARSQKSNHEFGLGQRERT